MTEKEAAEAAALAHGPLPRPSRLSSFKRTVTVFRPSVSVITDQR